MIPPQNYDEAKAFCCCQPYTDYHICIYAGGGSRTEHDMYWGYIVYDSEGMRRHDGRLPDTCLDIDDGMWYCRAIIDTWNRGVTYEDVFLWRAICEYLWLIKGKHAHHDPTHPNRTNQIVPGCSHLIGIDRTHRQMLWDLYKIQLITWTKATRRHEGWCLKGNWEDKIDFLEQVYILGRDPDTLPRTWLLKWERKQRQRSFKEAFDKLVNILDAIIWNLNEIHDPVIPSEDKYRFNVQGVTFQCQRAKTEIAAIALHFMDLTKQNN